MENLRVYSRKKILPASGLDKTKENLKTQKKTVHGFILSFFVFFGFPKAAERTITLPASGLGNRKGAERIIRREPKKKKPRPGLPKHKNNRRFLRLFF